MGKEFDPTVPLKNARWEKFAQNLAKGMSIGRAYAEAGYKATGTAATKLGSRLAKNDDIIGRVAHLQAGDVTEVTNVRDFARKHTKAAIDLHETAMNDTTLAMSVRLAAARELIERGHGKAPQTITVEPSAYDSLEFDDQRTLLAAIRLVRSGAGKDGERPSETRH